MPYEYIAIYFEGPRPFVLGEPELIAKTPHPHNHYMKKESQIDVICLPSSFHISETYDSIWLKRYVKICPQQHSEVGEAQRQTILGAFALPEGAQSHSHQNIADTADDDEPQSPLITSINAPLSPQMELTDEIPKPFAQTSNTEIFLRKMPYIPSQLIPICGVKIFKKKSRSIISPNVAPLNIPINSL